MKLIKVDSCTNCPLCSYYPTDYYRKAYFKCTKSGFDVTGNYYSGTIYERCQLENEPNSTNTVLCEPVSDVRSDGEETKCGDAKSVAKKYAGSSCEEG